MNQTRSHSIRKKFLALILAVIMVLSLMPMTVFAQEDGEHVQQEELDAAQSAPTGEDTQETGGADTYAATDDSFYRIVHLDCGRKYFSRDWIIALMHEAKAAGYNQIQLAFGNKGLRFLLDNMEVTANGTTYSSESVTKAIKAGNKNYYNAGDVNELTQTEMDEIFKAAGEIGIEIVPLFNTPFHMEAVISAMTELGIENPYYDTNKACLNLGSSEAATFVKTLMQKYVDYFGKSGKQCSFFSFGADEYTGGWNDTFYDYAGEIAQMIKNAEMEPRVFNDSYRKNSSNYIAGVDQVCYWTSYSSEYASTKSVYQHAKSIINTNQYYYYVVNKESQQCTWGPNAWYTFSGTYNEDAWVSYAKNFSNTDYMNFAGYNSGASSITPVGSMFCIWCDNPSHKDETQIAKETRMILRVIGARMQNSNAYTASDVLVDGGFDADGNIYYAEPETPHIETGLTGSLTSGKSAVLKLSSGESATWNTSAPDVVSLTASTNDGTLVGTEVIATAGKAGKATITAKTETAEYTTEITVAEQQLTGKTITVSVNGTAKDYQDESNGGTYTTDNEEIATVKATNVDIPGGTRSYEATASTNMAVYGSYSATNLIDGNNSTIFWSNEAQEVGDYVQVDIGAEIQFDAVRLMTPRRFNNQNVNDYCQNAKVMVSLDGTAWTDIGTYTGSGNNEANRTTVLTLPETVEKVRYIRIEIAEARNNWWQMGEIQWGTLNGSTFTRMEPTGTISTEPSKKTEIEFTGNAVGTTYVTIGNVRYTIEVVAEDLGNARPLYIDFWETNHKVFPKGLSVTTTTSNTTSNARNYATFTANDFYGENGKLLADVIPTAGNYDTVSGYETRYWKTRYLPSDQRQKESGWTNKSGFGTDVVTEEMGGRDIERIRYYGGTWAYLPVATTDDPNPQWTEFNTTETPVSQDESGAQVVVYYLLVTEVTKEVTTYVTDWTDPQSQEFFGVAVDYCVKYESGGDRNPNSFGKDKNNGHTQWFNCVGDSNEAKANGYVLDATDAEALSNGDWKGSASSKFPYYRVINNIEAVETDQYDIYMITVTPSTAFDQSYTTTDRPCPDDITYDESGEKIIWAVSEDEVTTSGLPTHAEVVYGGKPSVNRLVIQQRTGMLVTYYVRAKVTADSLTVHYIDDTNSTEFYSYNIAVRPNTAFPEEYDFRNYTLYDYQVENFEGQTETVQSDLKQMPRIQAQYRYSKFTCVRVVRVDDKNFNLYYTFDNQVTFVVDFGLPLLITPAKVNSDLDGKVNQVAVSKRTLKYGTVTDGANYGIIYTPDSSIDGYERIDVTYTGTNIDGINDTASYVVYVIPATTVYYEDSFVTFENGTGAAAGAVWTTDGKTTSANQLLEQLGSKQNPYGYDEAYDNCTTFSMGSAQKVTVSNAMSNGWNNDSTWPTATFTFRGTGFDVISLTDNDSGVVICKVTDSNGATVYNKFINNYYGYTYTGGEFAEAKSDIDNKLYQLPIIKFTSDKWDTYTVTLTPAYGDMFDKTGDQQYSFWLDAIRVYDPLGKDNTTYTTGNEKEGYPQYIELHDELVVQKDSETVTCIEGTVDADIAAYKNYGPNHEIYLAKDQAVAFLLAGDLKKINTVQLGLKAVDGDATYQINNMNAKTVHTATDMYYDITGSAMDGSGNSQLVTIVNTGDTILSLTNIKVTFKEQGTVQLATLTAEQQAEAVAAVRALFTTPVDPEPTPDPEPVTFEPSRFEASWGRSVRAGQKATLTVKTSEEVESVTVNGETVSTYRTRTERSGWGWWAKKVTYREFTYTVTAAATADYTVIARNGDGAVSQPITATLTVRGGNSWWGGIFGRWF